MNRQIAKRAAWLLLALWRAASFAKAEAEPRFAPGPTTISAEEQARIAGGGAVVLIEETRRLETSSGRCKVWYHLRAKLLSEAGLRLATLDIPNVDEATKVQSWWGNIVLPTGEAFTLPLAKLDDHVDPKTGVRSIQGKFSRATPGAVIDWGYVVTGARLPAFEIVPLQGPWPVDQLFYRWLRIGSPDDGSHIGGYQVAHSVPGIGVSRDNRGALLSAERLPPATSADGAAAALVLWTLHPVSIHDGSLVALTKLEERFWNERATDIDEKISDFAGKPERLQAQMQAIAFPPGAGVAERVRFAYAWIEANVAGRASKWSSTPGIAVVRTRGRADKVLAARVGADIDRVLLFVSIARELGADATLVLATDRRAWEWDHGMLLIEQFSYALVQVRGADGKLDWVAVGSGLPYGEIPARASGEKALQATSEGARTVETPGSR